MSRLAYLTHEGQVKGDEEAFESPEEIASHFEMPLTKVEQVCQWADEENCAQGFATGPADSLIVEPWEKT